MNEIKPVEKVFDAVLHQDFKELINYSAKEYRDTDAFIIKHKKGKKEVFYEHITFETFRNQINCLGSGMLKKGWKGKRVAIIGKNCYQWMLGYFATLCGLGVCIPLDRGLPYDELESSLVRSYADILIFDAGLKDTIEELKENNNTKITEYICMTELKDYISIGSLTEYGKQAMAEGFDEYLNLPVDGKAVTILLFTSGTTSMAKAVQLSQYNILANVYAMLMTQDFHHGDINMAFLPYHHTFGSTGQIVMIASGITSTFCDGLKYIQKNIAEYKVSLFVCVPLLIESIYKRIMTTVKKEGMEKKIQFGLKMSKFLLKLGIDKRRQIFKPILDQLGGNLRYVISGASAIDPIALEAFNDFGITAVQGYGMTEASPVLCAENTWNRSTGSIGKPLPGIELKIFEPNEDGIGELIARGPNIMAGYFENEEETAKVLIDGWLHTGDLAKVDHNGFVYICGRKKNVIVLKNGKNVYPEELEVLISNLPYVEECMVFGQPRFNDGNHKDLAICAKIVYKADYMKESYGVSDHDEIETIIKRDIDAVNDELPVYKQMLRVIVTDEPMVKTTTGKVKRYEETKKI